MKHYFKIAIHVLFFTHNPTAESFPQGKFELLKAEDEEEAKNVLGFFFFPLQFTNRLLKPKEARYMGLWDELYCPQIHTLKF